MDLNEARDLAEALMEDFDLTRYGWTFRWDDSVRRFGVCRFTDYSIGLSRKIVRMNDRAEVEDTIRHEIAHALAPRTAAHGPVWEAFCEVTGAKPQRCSDAKAPEPGWVVRCPSGCQTHRRYRVSSRLKTASCGYCHETFVIERATVDEIAQMG